jgi:hypothetical protein
MTLKVFSAQDPKGLSLLCYFICLKLQERLEMAGLNMTRISVITQVDQSQAGAEPYAFTWICSLLISLGWRFNGNAKSLCSSSELRGLTDGRFCICSGMRP